MYTTYTVFNSRTTIGSGLVMEIEDDVHGTIRVSEDIKQIIEHRFFQRLKMIRQLGFTEPGYRKHDEEIKHNRYKHSIGTYYSALKAVEAIESNTEWIKRNEDRKIPRLYRDAVLLAALLHDIGHGPFSHTWESVDPEYDHEAMSGKLIDKIFAECPQIFGHLRENTNRGIDLIKALITGQHKDFKHSLPNKYRFIFEIVSNKLCQIDVDKWDYLKRDGRLFGKESLIDFDEIFLNARASEDGAHVEYSRCDVYKIIQLFTTRWIFHKEYYLQNRATVCDVLLAKIIKPKYTTSKLKQFYQLENFANFTDETILRAIKDDSLTKFLNVPIESYKKNSIEEFDSKFTSLSDSWGGEGDLEVKPVFKYFPYKEACFYPDHKITEEDKTYPLKKQLKFCCSDREVFDNVQYVTIVHEISDKVHGKILIPEDISTIIRNSFFERLKSIRQLGFVKLHSNMDDGIIECSRYEHCIGTYHLALKAIEAIEKNTEWIRKNEEEEGKIPSLYRNAILLAALLHDIGHAAFSHSWEDVDSDYDHEIMSWKLIDKIFTENVGIFLPLQEFLTDFEEVFLNARVSEDGAHIEYLCSDGYKIIQLFIARWIFYRDYYCQTRNIICNAILRKIIKRNYTSNELKNFYQIENFLNFTDEKILTAIKDDTLTKFLKKSIACKEIPSKEFQNFCEHLHSTYSDSESFHIQPVSKYFPKNKVQLYPDRADFDTIPDLTIVIRRTINFLCSERDNAMDILDKIYGVINLSMDVQAIVESPLFKRLKSIRQLGFMKLGYNTNDRIIEHNRYNHSIGTYHNALLTLEAIEKNTEWIRTVEPEGKIPSVYRDAVLLAALLHDIGHGPFSHTWEIVDPEYDHEAMSGKLIDEIFAECPQIFGHLRENTNRGIDLIKALITGQHKDFKHSLPNKYRFIFEIVSNKLCQIDVDKWDYLKRDGRLFGKESLIDFDEIFLNARASEDGAHVEYSCCDVYKIIQLFTARWTFYRDYYSQTYNIMCNAILRKIIGRRFATIDLKKFYEINNFLNFIDAELIETIKGDNLTRFLDESTTFKEVSSKEFQAICSCLVGSYIDRQFIYIENILKYFPKNEVRLYPNRGMIDVIVDETYSIRKQIDFVCSESYDIGYIGIRHCHHKEGKGTVPVTFKLMLYIIKRK
uniref:HD/PDEase domain-containing protein n=1 Tax=Glossina brevipalpis TaxID=37001 RepID=A0A1A9WGB9_9MUSC